MAAPPRFYRSMEEFERDEIKPALRVGFSFEDLVEETAFESESLFDESADFDDGSSHR